MTTYSKVVWDQIKNTTIQDIQRALKKDGWSEEISSGATIGYRHPTKPVDRNRIVLHLHPKATKGPKLMKGLLDSIGWSESDMVRLKLIKK